MNKVLALALAALVLGFVGGYSIRADSERNRATQAQDELLHASELSHAALRTTEFVMLLKLLRDQKPDMAAQRLETLLDFALIDLARDYSPTRDSLGTASNALRFARSYRADHPRQPDSGDTGNQVDAALRIVPTRSP
jgi:hypothetical protein